MKGGKDMQYEDMLFSDELAQKMRGRDLLTLKDLSLVEVQKIFEVTRVLKEKTKKGIPHPILAGKTLGMIFLKSSTRTRVSFEVAMWQLGGYPLYLDGTTLQMQRGEPIQDTARVLSRYLDGIMIRTFAQSQVEQLAEYADIPVINGLTDSYHPCQVLADLFTCMEYGKDLQNSRLVYIGDGNNVANSLLIGASLVGMDISINAPEGYQLSQDMLDIALENARESGSRIMIEKEPDANVDGADIIYTDVWASMGMEDEVEERRKAFEGYQVNGTLMKRAKPDAIVMHCLPAHRGEEITDEVMESEQSVVFDQAENRLHVQKAILALLLR
jgi:ornithine carbamoyltransferase